MSKKSKNKNKPAVNQNENKAVEVEKDNTRLNKLNDIYINMIEAIKLDSNVTNKELERVEKLYNSFPTLYTDLNKDGHIRLGKQGLSLFNSQMNKEMSNHKKTKKVFDGLLSEFKKHIRNDFNSKFGSGEIKLKEEKQVLTYFDFCCGSQPEVIKEYTKNYVSNNINEYKEKHHEALLKLLFVNYIDI